jgi:riboflavin synthase
MFTGIIQDIGEVAAIDKQGDWTLTIKTEKLPLDEMAVGASVACNGICLTITEKTPEQFKVQVSMETLSKTTAIHWQRGQRINLEAAVRAGEELGGHLLSGHIDGVVRVLARKPEEGSLRYEFEAPPKFAKYLAPKGSIAIDGVSLTVNEVKGAYFGVNIIPHTQQVTVFDTLTPGGEANFEVDMIARYVERIVSLKAAS